MAYQRKNGGWKDRVSQFPSHRTLTNVSSGVSEIYSVSRAEGTVTEEGDAFSAANMNDFDDRIEAECTALEKAFAKQQTTSSASTGFAVGDYLVYDGKFYKVIRTINTGDSLVVGSNITATNVGQELKALASSITQVSGSVGGLSTSINNAINSLNNDIRSTQATLQQVANTRPIGKVNRFTNFSITNGVATVTGLDCSDVIPTRAVAVTITAHGVDHVFGVYLTEANRSSVGFVAHDLNNPSFTGGLAEVDAIVWGI